jgi:hypothetical protein
MWSYKAQLAVLGLMAISVSASPIASPQVDNAFALQPNSCQPHGPTQVHNGNTNSCKVGQLAASTFGPYDPNFCPGVSPPANNYYAAVYNPGYVPKLGGPPSCGKVIKISNKKSPPTTIDVTVTDGCPGCIGFPNHNGATIDLSPEAFGALFGMADGVYDVEYTMPA